MRRATLVFSIILVALGLPGNHWSARSLVVAQDAAAPAAAKPNNDEAFTAAIELIPESVAGLIRVSDVPKFCTKFKETNFGRLLDDPAMQPFIESQREQARSYFENLGNRVGLRLEDLYDVSSGEAVVAWLPFESDARRPYTLVVVTDVRGRQKQVDKALAKIDADLKRGQWTRKDQTHLNQEIRVYDGKPKPGQIKIEQIALASTGDRLIASDRDSVVIDILDAIAGESRSAPIAGNDQFKDIMKRSAEDLLEVATKDKAFLAAEWFARPFSMGRIMRESLGIDRGDQIDVLQLLENQGFDAVQAAGGAAVIAGKQFDVLHRGHVLAPPTGKGAEKYTKAARMLALLNQPIEDIPVWVGDYIAGCTRINLDIEKAFWAAETLVNEALDDDLFRGIVEGIRDDEAGPQIDLEKDVLPNLAKHILLMSDNTEPVNTESERLLGAIRVTNPDVIKEVIRKTMEVDPDASLIEGPEGVDIWQVSNDGVSEDEFEDDLFDDFGDEEIEESEPILSRWAAALVPIGKNSKHAYLMVSSHPELLQDVAGRIMGTVEGSSLAGEPEIASVLEKFEELGFEDASVNRVVRTRLSLRAKYQLLRRGELKDNDSLISSLIRRLIEDESDDADPRADVQKLPPLKQIEKYFPVGGNVVRTTDDGWSLTGFFLK
ncbi:MAG: membrane or secreted protein [Planctomycetota bacterium]